MNQFKKLATVLPLKSDAKVRARILVVDDDLDTVHSMAMLLKTMGHEVDFAINGFAAIDVARKFRPQIILLDINLPDVQGDKLVRQLKFEPGLEAMRIIAVSGHSDEDTRQRALRAGCEEFHVKPMGATTLEEVIAK